MKNVKLLGIAVLMTGLAAGAGWAGDEATPGGADPGKEQPGVAIKERGEGHGEKSGRMEGGIGQKLAKELGLSAEKTAEIKNLMHETRKTMIKLKADRDIARADLDQLFTADTLDEKAIMAAVDNLAQVNAEMTRAIAKGRLAVNATLTAEQRARLQQLRQGMIERFKQRGESRRSQWREKHGQGGDESGAGQEAGGAEF